MFDGIAYHYSAYLDETKVGAISLLEYESTEEHNGTTITVPVKRNDFSTFYREIVKVTRYWQIRPEFNIPVEYPATEVLLEGENWRLVKEDEHRPTRVLIADLPLDVSIYQLQGLTDQERSIFNTSLLINFPIGKLTIAVNRESLQYDPATQLALKQALSEIKDEVAIATQEKINTMSSLAEVTRFVFGKLPEAVYKSASFTYKGQQVEAVYKTDVPFTTYEKHRWRKRLKTDSTSKVELSAKSAIVINDTGKKLAFKAQEGIDQLDVEKVYYLFLEEGVTWDEFIEAHPIFDKDHLNAIRWSEVYVPKPKAKRAAKSASKPKGFITAYKFREKAGGSGNGIYAFSDTVDIDVAATGVYFVITGFERNSSTAIELNLTNVFYPDNRVLERWKKLLGREIYGVRECNVPKLGEGWRHLNVVANEFIETHLECLANFRNTTVADLIVEFNVLTNIQAQIKGRGGLSDFVKVPQEQRLSILGQISAACLVADMFIKVTDFEDTLRQYGADIQLASFYTLSAEGKEKVAQSNYLQQLLEQVYAKYPLIDFLMDHYFTVGVDKLSHYINLI